MRHIVTALMQTSRTCVLTILPASTKANSDAAVVPPGANADTETQSTAIRRDRTAIHVSHLTRCAQAFMVIGLGGASAAQRDSHQGKQEAFHGYISTKANKRWNLFSILDQTTPFVFCTWSEMIRAAFRDEQTTSRSIAEMEQRSGTGPRADRSASDRDVILKSAVATGRR